MINPLLTILREKGDSVFSVCSANETVIRAAMRAGNRRRAPILVEATANQVNQFGGYTGMTPLDFANWARNLAREEGFPEKDLILGGDHLGPLTWQGEDAGAAMEKAEELIRRFVEAGYLKIHIDTSMRLFGDDPSAPLPVELVAGRSARLARAAQSAYERLLKKTPGAPEPVYVIGSEVPVPGGAQTDGEAVSVTEAADFRKMMETFRAVYLKEGLGDVYGRIVAAVVQPGVEFSDDTVTEYDPEKAKALTSALKDFPGLCFEGHSTDYQKKESLRRMTRDGIRILKVGPALTFAAREGLFALEALEKEVCAGDFSNFRAVLDGAMRSDDRYWAKYYRGTEREIALKRAFSYSDRARYYMGDAAVRASEEKLLQNLDAAKIPLSALHQFLPAAYDRLRRDQVGRKARDLLIDSVRNVLDDYFFACEK